MINQPVFKFYSQLIFLGVIIYVLGYFINQRLNTNFLAEQYLLLILGNIIICSAAFQVFNIGVQKSPDKSVFITLAAFGVKLILYLALIVFFKIMFKQLNNEFIINFMLLYGIFTSYFVTYLLKWLKKI